MYYLLKDIKTIVNSMRKHLVYAFAAQAAFFMTFSFIPMVMMAIMAIRFLPYSQSQIASLISYVFPSALADFISTAVNGVFTGYSGLFVAIVAFLFLWAASKGMFAITSGLNTVYETGDQRGFFSKRGTSMLHTLMLGIMFMSIIMVLIFVINIVKIVGFYLKIINIYRINYSYIGSLVLLSIIFDAIYAILPRQKMDFRKELPGAVFAAFGWIVFSWLYSYYLKRIGNVSIVYGSLSAIFLLMLWMYFVMYIFFIGAEINLFIQAHDMKEVVWRWFFGTEEKHSIIDCIVMFITYTGEETDEDTGDG